MNHGAIQEVRVQAQETRENGAEHSCSTWKKVVDSRLSQKSQTPVCENMAGTEAKN